MSYSEKDLETFQKNVLKPEDTFHFECAGAAVVIGKSQS